MTSPTTSSQRWRRRVAGALFLLAGLWLAVRVIGAIVTLIIGIVTAGVTLSILIMGCAVMADIFLHRGGRIIVATIDALWTFWFLNGLRAAGLVRFIARRVHRLIAALELDCLPEDVRRLAGRFRGPRLGP